MSGGLTFPRYEVLGTLGKGGGGEVLSARDTLSGARVAIKVLHAFSGSAETDALLREITALSGLEGLGFPRVLEVGRLPEGRLYLVRELVEGESLANLLVSSPERAARALVLLAETLTVVHRTGLLHGDVKPENAIVLPSFDVSLVDLGLATALREQGNSAAGFTPHYAPPEVHEGFPLTVQGEIYSLGIILKDLLERSASHFGDEVLDQLRRVAGRATAVDPEARFPSADEFGAAVSVALGGDVPRGTVRARPWPVLGVDALALRLHKRLEALEAKSEFFVRGERGAGRTTLLRRLVWGLGLRGVPAVFVDEISLGAESGEAELERVARSGGFVVIDAELDELPASIERARAKGARLVRLGRPSKSALDPSRELSIPPLEEAAVKRLLRGSLPGLSPDLVPRVLRETGGCPLALREFVELAGDAPLVSEADLTRVLSGKIDPEKDPLTLAEALLDRGHYKQAALELTRSESSSTAKWLLARYEIAAGSAEKAHRLAEEALLDSTLSEELYERIVVTRARALLGLGRYQEGLASLSEVDAYRPAARIEGLAYRGLGQSLLGDQAPAVVTLRSAYEGAVELGVPRLVALTGSSLATAEWRNGDLGRAITSYESAIEAATRAGDSGQLASALINLAGLKKERGDLESAIELLERAADAAKRAGRTASVQQALLNLTNLDLYLGRLARARASLLEIGAPEALAPAARAQLYGLEAELSGREGELERADAQYAACERAWAEIGRKKDAAEAALEAVLVLASARSSGEFEYSPSEAALGERLDRARELLGDERLPLQLLAESRTFELADRFSDAEGKAREALDLARERGQKEWIWRALVVLSDLLEAAGQTARAARARAEALEVLEEIASRLPPDLRAVYFSEPRRARLRNADTHPASKPPLAPGASRASGFEVGQPSGSDAVSRLSQTPLERRLAKILAVNADLAGEFDLDRLAEKIVGHAADLLGTERAYLLLGGAPDELEIRASRLGQGAAHREFSRSIAARVLSTGEPLVSIDAGRDQRLRGFESVHLAVVSAVACVPVRSPAGESIGAIYLETRRGSRPDFAAEIPTLLAFADQVAIALENSRLLGELRRKTELLDERNERLAEAQTKLRELLERKSARLREMRKELRSHKDRASGSYRGLVGESASMRRVYALIERVQETDVPVLITGESGTGKEVVARAIHEGSARKNEKMLAVNCGAIPESILESELFGHVRGAFTGAERERKGLFLEATGGTLFLDEIGETPLKMQAGLLRVLQERKVRKVGGAGEDDVDVRVIFATNRDLDEAARKGLFREDLLYRIQVVVIHLPPLRERKEDIPLLVEHFLGRFALRFGAEKKSIERGALDLLMNHPLPGNVRQLENLLLNAWVMSEEATIGENDFSLPEIRSERAPSAKMEPARETSSHQKPPKKGTLSEHQRGERARIVSALEKTGWNRVRAAELLDMPRRTFYRRLAEYGIQ